MGRLRPLVAALLSGIVFGLGHLFAGYPRRALVILFATFFLMAWAVVCFRFAGGSPQRLALALLAGLAPMALVAVDAWRLTRRGQRLPFGRAGRWTCYAAFAVAGLIFNSIASHYIREHWLEPIFIPSAGMAPTLLPGDRFLVDHHAYAGREPALDDVVMYRTAGDRRIARIAALPGDTVPGGDGVIPPDQYFLLGDNRDNSLDSRRIGTIPRADILASVLYLTYSIDPETSTLRTERIGRIVK